MLAARGFAIEHAPVGIPTAFQATYQHLNSEQMRRGLRHPHIAIVAEYHAEPQLGHSYGRNLNAGAALALALALADAADVAYGHISVFGCPGSLGGSTKVALADVGLFDAADVALGMRPASTGEGAFFTIDSSGNTLAGADGTLRFVSADGAAQSDFRTALDEFAASLDSDERIDVADGGDDASLAITIRAPRVTRVRELSTWVQARATVAAAEWGARAQVSMQPPIPEMLVSRVLIRRARTHAGAVGLRLDAPKKTPLGEPNDWGAVGYRVPSADCWFPIIREPVSWGTTAFAHAADTPEAYEQMFLAATAVALTGVDVLTDINVRAIVDNMLLKAQQERGIDRPHRRWTGVHPVLPKPAANGAEPADLA
jgi:metal-dependent amidase/aminoacylase/carboxypeptidase family protein